MSHLERLSPIDPLSDREREILLLLSEGMTNRQIAQRLFLSVETIKWYNKHLYGKLDVSNRTQAVARAREMGLLAPSGTAKDAKPIPTNLHLPAQLSSFVGREVQISEVSQLLTKARLVTLTGPGGTGKTRLGLQVAVAQASHHPDGIHFVSLAAINDPDLVPTAIAQTYGISENPNQPLHLTLKQFLADKTLLILIDNFEHLLTAAPLITDLLAAAPRLTVLATSREALHLSGEHEYMVPPLTLPPSAKEHTPATLLPCESVMLFVQRARAANTNFHLTEQNAAAIADICVRLEGLPLALELAAARIKLFTPQQLLKWLVDRLGLLTGGPRDYPARQRTLRDTIEWSYQLLSADEQRLFARLGVFAGGRSLAAIQSVCSADLKLDAVDGIASLLNKSLLYQREGPGAENRFYMLDTIQDFALERLEAAAEKQLVQNNHLLYFLELAEEMDPGYWSHDQLRLLERSETELGNLRSAFEWALASEQFEAAARLVSAIAYFLYYKDRYVEGYRWIKRLLPVLDGIAPPHRLRFLLSGQRIAWANIELEQSKRFSHQARQLALELGDRRSEAYALLGLSISAIGHKDRYAEGIQHGESGLAIFQNLNDQAGLAFAYNILGEVARLVGDYDQAHHYYEASLACSIETGEIIRQVLMEQNLGFTAYQQGDYQRAAALFASYIQKLHELKNRQSIIAALACLAGPLSQLGEAEKAARLLGAAAALLIKIGAAHHPSDMQEIDIYTTATRSRLDKDSFEAAWANGAMMTREDAVDFALAVVQEITLSSSSPYPAKTSSE